MDYQVTVYSLLYVIAGIAASIFFLYTWDKRPAPGAFFLSLFELAVAIWSFSVVFEMAATTVALKQFWSQVSYIGIASSPLLFFFFSLDLSRLHKYLRRNYIFIFSVLPILFFIIALTNNIHHSFWTSIDIQEHNNVAIYGHGIIFWLFVGVSYTYLIGGIAILLTAIYSYPSFYKQQFVIMIIASIFPFGGNIMYIFNLNPIPGIDWTPLFFTFSGGLIALGIIRYRMFDLIPMAHQQVLQKIADGIIVIDNQDRIIEVNTAFRDLLGIGERNLIGQSIHEEINDLPECIGYHDKEAYLEEFIKNDNGNQRIYDVHCNPLHDKKGILLGRIIVYRDITLRKRTEEALMLSNQKLEKEIKEREKLIEELDAFTRTVAHDLKNPLSAMTACSDILIDTLKNDPESSLEFAELIKESGTTMVNIVNSLLLMARVSHQSISLQNFDMTGPVMGSLNRLRNLIDEKNATVEYPPSWPMVKGYEPWIEEIWVNYISNALKYGGSPPVLEIGYDDNKDNTSTFWVKDNGNGIRPEDMERLFTDFERLGKIGEGGHGLGLAIVKRIVEKLGGKVEVNSENIPGKGARFGFILTTAEN